MNKIITGIMAIDQDGLIGIGDKIPWHYPEEFKHFQNVTYGQIIIMGRKTFESLPKTILQNRHSIVFSKFKKKENNILNNNITFVSSLKEFNNLKNLPNNLKLYMIGGGEIAKLFLSKNLIQEFILTKINNSFSKNQDKESIPRIYLDPNLFKNCSIIKETKYDNYTIVNLIGFDNRKAY